MDANQSTRRFGYAILTVVGLLNVGAVLDLGRGFEIYGAVFWGGLLLFGLLLYLAHYVRQRSTAAVQRH
jgi:hypothetical membrane protein